MKRVRLATGAAALALLVGFGGILSSGAAQADPTTQEIYEDFEGFDPDTTVGVPFEIGPAGKRAEFAGNAWAGNAFSLAHGGVRAWMVRNAAADGTITFLDQPASEVEFYARGRTFGMTIRAYDPDGVLIGSPVSVNDGDGFVLVSFTGPVDHIDVTNHNAGDFVSVDDFGYSVAAPPGVPAFGLLGLGGVAALLTAAGWAGLGGRRGEAGVAPGRGRCLRLRFWRVSGAIPCIVLLQRGFGLHRPWAGRCETARQRATYLDWKLCRARHE